MALKQFAPLAGWLAAACIITWQTRAATAEDGRPTVYRIDARVVEKDAHGKVRVLSQPVLRVLARQDATLQVGQQMVVPIDDGEVAQVETGITCRFTPYPLKDGKVKLDVDIEIVEASHDMDAAIVAEKFGVRRIQEAPLGAPIEMSIGRTGKHATHHLRIEVTEVSKDDAEDDVPPPPGAKAAEEIEDVFRFFSSGGR